MIRLRSLAVAAAVAFAPMAAAGPIPPDFLDDLPEAEIVLLGEVHGNPTHHQLQARAVAGLSPAAIVWEMLTPEQAARLPEDLTQADAVARAVDWQGSGWPDFDFYHPIMLAAPNAVHLGAEVTREQARRVFEEPLPAVFEDLFAYPAGTFGLSEALTTADQAMREALQAAAHCDALPAHLLPGMVDAQRLRDGALAAQVIQALEQTGGPVAVITGAGHARRDMGVPRKLAVAAPDLRVLSLAMLEADPGPDAPFDHWIVTDPQSREDPCAAFR